MALFRGINPCKAYLVLNVLAIEDGHGITVGNTYHASGDRFGKCWKYQYQQNSGKNRSHSLSMPSSHAKGLILALLLDGWQMTYARSPASSQFVLHLDFHSWHIRSGLSSAGD